MPRTWEITDEDGSNRRAVTLEQYRAELRARRPYCERIMAAIKVGELAGVAEAQTAMRNRFPK